MTTAQLPEIVGGRYRPLRLLGRGGMGSVYEAEHVHTGERVALKLISATLAGAEAVERFKREARTFAAIKSPHLARITDAGTAPELDDAPFFVMELLDGEDLSARVAREGPQLPDDVVSWLEQAARALARAHERGIVHRDLKPANLFVARQEGAEILKVLDFGVAKIADASAQTASGAIVGTPRYMAPEQARGEGASVTPAADVWSLAMIAFTLLAGRPYFQADGVAGILASVLFDEIAAPSTHGCALGPAFDAWFLRSTSRDAAARFSSVADQAAALRDALAGRERLMVPAAARAPVVAAATLSFDDALPAVPDPSASVERSASVDVTPPLRTSSRAPILVAAVVALAAIVGLSARWLGASAAKDPTPSAAPSGAPRETTATPSSATAPSSSAAAQPSAATSIASARKPETPPPKPRSSDPRPAVRPPPTPIDPFATQK